MANGNGNGIYKTIATSLISIVATGGIFWLVVAKDMATKTDVNNLATKVDTMGADIVTLKVSMGKVTTILEERP